jgi:hypothetical protein
VRLKKPIELLSKHPHYKVYHSYFFKLATLAVALFLRPLARAKDSLSNIAPVSGTEKYPRGFFVFKGVDMLYGHLSPPPEDDQELNHVLTCLLFFWILAF